MILARLVERPPYPRSRVIQNVSLQLVDTSIGKYICLASQLTGIQYQEIAAYLGINGCV